MEPRLGIRGRGLGAKSLVQAGLQRGLRAMAFLQWLLHEGVPNPTLQVPQSQAHFDCEPSCWHGHHCIARAASGSWVWMKTLKLCRPVVGAVRPQPSCHRANWIIHRHLVRAGQHRK